MDLSTEQQVGAYRIVRQLGKGGMSEVYEIQMPDGQHLAMKVFDANGEHAEFLRKRFVAEGRILARLDHPHLMKVHEIGFDGCGRPWFTMDVVLGSDGKPHTLEDLRKAHALDECRIVEIYAAICEGLTYLHARGVVHRDIKTQNVLIDAAGHVVLSDFGIAKVFDPDFRHEISETTTKTGERAPLMGSYGYFAPELKRGESATPASDAYALGALIFRLLTGVWYEADSTAMDLLSGFDPAWREVLAKLLSEDASKRLPIPPRIVLGGAHRRRLFRGIVLSVLICLLSVGAVWAYVALRQPQYSFDEFFVEGLP